ncbi:MAG: restriction endonuclease, partial [Prevotella sp.]|nr:restriction endonuclease [Prevotella sp.]
MQDKAGTTPGNYCMIEVKPNWHDSTELLGYYSRLGKAGYQFTKFVKFLVKAKMFPNVPFFVCLDEMNLAPVEQYFAEILSILETR